MIDATYLGPDAVSVPDAELFDGEVLDDALALGDEVRCRRSSVDARSATDPLPWNPVSRPAGWFYPKRDDRAILAFPIDGPPVIVQFFPSSGATPDVAA